MSVVLAPIGFALFLWWFSTGLILLADRLPKVTAHGALIAATVFGLGAFGAAWWVRDDLSVSGAFIGFTAGLVLWGWHEVSFLSGLVTGPRRTECPQDAKGWRRFVYATQTLIHHELAIAATVFAIGALLWSADNQVALWTFVILWGMRLSTKFNIFLGVPNVTEEFLPKHLSHLKSYFRTRPLNLLFPLSVTVGTCLASWLAHFALQFGADAYTVTAFVLLATLTTLGVIEHWFLVLPLRDAELWRWYLKPGAAAPSKTPKKPFVGSPDKSLEQRAFPAPNALRGHQS